MWLLMVIKNVFLVIVGKCNKCCVVFVVLMFVMFNGCDCVFLDLILWCIFGVLLSKILSGRLIGLLLKWLFLIVKWCFFVVLLIIVYCVCLCL